MKDGLSSENLTLTGTLSGATLEVAESVSAAEISANAIGTSEQAFVGTGSPPVYASRILHGNDTIPAATSKWIVFGDKFLGTPDVVIGGDAAVTITDIGTGSFLASGAASTEFCWVALGSA